MLVSIFFSIIPIQPQYKPCYTIVVWKGKNSMAPHGPDLLFPLALCSSWGAEKKEMETAVYIYTHITLYMYIGF